MESLRMQTRDNLERMVVIKAFIAVRVLGLRQGVSVKKHKMTAVRKSDADRVETAVG
ncbi:ST52 protein [Escherichia coli DEC2A]|nr:ST52 protein [Escherichia coli DEC2A]